MPGVGQNIACLLYLLLTILLRFWLLPFQFIWLLFPQSSSNVSVINSLWNWYLQADFHFKKKTKKTALVGSDLLNLPPYSSLARRGKNTITMKGEWCISCGLMNLVSLWCDASAWVELFWLWPDFPGLIFSQEAVRRVLSCALNVISQLSGFKL